MPIEQAQKHGLDQFKNDPGLEIRLRKIERELALRNASNNDSTETRILPSSSVPPAPTGLALVPGLEDVAVKWNAVDIGNLKQYEVQIDTADTFNSPTIFKTTLLNHNFIGLDSNTTYYVRVRAITIGGADGSWSGTLNTTTGQVTNSQIEDGTITTDKFAQNATAKITTAVQSGTVTLTTSYSPILTLSVTKDEDNSTLVIWFGFNAYINGAVTRAAQVQFRRDATTLVSIGATAGVLWNANRDFPFSFATVDTSAAGTYSFSIQGQQTAGNDVDCTQGYIFVQEVKA